MKNLEPKGLWESFYSLTQIPRPSGKRKEIADFLVNYGKSLGLETLQDEIGNVLIRKPASPGMEKKPGIILQGHMDMVPQKNSDKVFDFEEVYLKDVYGRYQRWGKGSIGTIGTIKAGVDSVNRWKLVTGPQQASPTIVLKTGDGKEYAFGCPYSGGLYFYAGYQLTLSVVLDESVSSNYTSEIVDWSDDGEVVFDHEAYLRKKQTAALLEELAGDYEATSSAEAYINPWVITVKPANDKIGFVNLFSGNASWATDDMMYFGTLSDDLSSIIIPFWQASEFVYNGSPFYLLGMDANGFNGDLYDEGNATATIVRDPTTGAVTGLDFGDFGFMSYLPNGGYVGYCLPHITATKKVQ